MAELLDAEADLTAIRLTRLEALHAMNMSLARLEFAVGAPLSEGEIK